MALVASCLVITEAHAAPPQITKAPWAQRVTERSAIVRVEVSPPLPVRLELRALGSPDGGAPSSRVVSSEEPAALHALTLEGLEPGTRYSYTVRAGSAASTGAFITAPPLDSEAPFRFLVYGDNRSDEAAHASIVRLMSQVPSDFLIHTGDFVERGESARQWQTFFDIEAPLLTTRCVYSAVGNHELTDGSGIEYARFFGPTDLAVDQRRPEAFNGTFRWGTARFILLNGFVSFKPSGTERAWLDKVLTESDAEPGVRWRIVVVHHGPWSSGPHGGNARLHDAGVPALLKQHHVDLVLSGHDHLYERGFGEPGLAYVVSGGGGAPPYRVKSTIPESRKVESVRHFVEVAVTPKSLSLVATRGDGTTIERCGLEKDALGWNCDAPAAVAPGASSTSVPSSPRAESAPTSRCTCREALGGPAGTSPVGVVFALSALMSALMTRRLSRSSSAKSTGRLKAGQANRSVRY